MLRRNVNCVWFVLRSAAKTLRISLEIGPAQDRTEPGKRQETGKVSQPVLFCFDFEVAAHCSM